MGFQRGTLLIVLVIVLLVPSLAHAHGFPWWFGYLVISPFMIIAVMIAVPCKTAILRRVMATEDHVLSVRWALILMLLDLITLFISLSVYGMVSTPIRDYLTYNIIDHTIGWQNRVKFEGTCHTVTAFLLGSIMTVLCAAITWFPHYGIVRRGMSERLEAPGINRRLLFWSFVAACLGPGIFWFPACLRFL
jgi:putative exporter of polyketide antibiotics